VQGARIPKNCNDGRAMAERLVARGFRFTASDETNVTFGASHFGTPGARCARPTTGNMQWT